MMGHAEVDLAKLRSPLKVRPMEQPDSGDSQTSPGYDGNAEAQEPKAEETRAPRRQWDKDSTQFQPKAALVQPLCYLVPETKVAPRKVASPFQTAEQSRFGAHGGVRSYSCQSAIGKSLAVVAKLR